MITPEEYMAEEKPRKIPTPDEYMGTATKVMTPEEYEMQEPPFIAKHPNLYGLYGAAKGVAESIGKVGHIKYADPYEIKKLLALSPQEQKRQLLMDTLEDVSMLAFTKATPKAPAIPKQTQKMAKEVMDEATTPDAVKRVWDAIKQAKPLRKEQERLYTIERGKRIGESQTRAEGLEGQEWAKAHLSALKGKMPKVDFEPLKIAQEDMDAIFSLAKNNLTNPWEQTTAIRGLGKLFGEFGGTVPQQSEMKVLMKFLPKEFVDDLAKNIPVWKQMKMLGYETINVPRAIMASFDLSAPLRQGLFLAPSHPVRFMQSFFKMFKQFGSEKAYQAVQESLMQKKWFGLLQENGLRTTDVGAGLEAAEEAFMGANFAEKIPLAGKVVRASNRAYTGFLNKLRVDVGNDLMEKASKAGLNPEADPELVQAITRFVNAGTGRGGLGPLENSAVLLNSLFFSPRLMSSRLTLLNPLYYVNQTAFVRKEALKSLFAFTGAIGTTLGLADMVPGVEVGKDPRSANFGKIIIGNTRLDIVGGFQQYIRAAAQLATGKYISSTTGKEFTLGEGYKPMTRFDILERVGESKLSPPASFTVAMLKQKDAEGKPVTVPKEIGKRFVPMVMQDIYDIAKDDPDLLPLSALGIFGVGLQTYKPRTSQSYMRGIGSIEPIEKLKWD